MNGLESLQKAATVLDLAVGQLVILASDNDELRKKAEATFNGTSGAWRRVGGMNLFLRQGDGVIMNGPRALQGQPMGNINADDFRAIPHVKEIHASQGSKASPCDDISEKASGTNVTTLLAEDSKAVVTKGFGKISVVLHAQVGKGRYSRVESKDFPATGKKGEVIAFEKAKAWARTKLRGTGRNKVKAK